jgi:hypothetical protein
VSATTSPRRYVEFNLVYDRGTPFGLQSTAGPAAIHMSLRPSCLALTGALIRARSEGSPALTARPAA